MKVQMIAGISGSRDGQDWPAPGEALECSDAEAAELISAGIARPIEKKSAPAKVETATAPKNAEIRKGSK